MIYLSGKNIECTKNIGVMLSFNAGRQPLKGHQIFAADNGCFAQPEKFTNEGFLQWLLKLEREKCIFATAPDVVGDAVQTRIRSYPMLQRIRNLGFKAAFVCQDGETPEDIRWDQMDAIFIGGSTDWKLSQAAGEIINAAKIRNKWVHMGRVNSFKRLRLAAALGCDSADGTFLAFAPDKNKKILLNWMQSLHSQPFLTMRE